MILCISVLSAVISPFTFLILLIWLFSLFFLMSLANGLFIFICWWITSICCSPSTEGWLKKICHIYTIDINCIFFTYPSVDGHLGCFHVLATVNSAAVNTGVHISFWIMVFSRHMPRSGIAGLYGTSVFSWLLSLIVSVCLVLEEIAKLFSKVTATFYISTINVWEIYFPCILESI